MNSLDMALDDVIKAKPRGNNLRSQRGGINKRQSSRSNNRASSHPTRASTARPPRGAATTSQSSNQLQVSNLHYNVTEKDLYELFGQIGPVRRAFLHLGPTGKSSGTADIVYKSGKDAEKAIARYDNVELDGRPMRFTSAAVQVAKRLGQTVSTRSQRPSSGRGIGKGRRGGREGRERRPKATEKDLDAEMDSYMGNSANNTSGGVINEDIEMA